jgi:hypothetical protein
MARQKQIIAELKAKGADIDEAERTLAMLSDKIAASHPSAISYGRSAKPVPKS